MVILRYFYVTVPDHLKDLSTGNPTLDKAGAVQIGSWVVSPHDGRSALERAADTPLPEGDEAMEIDDGPSNDGSGLARAALLPLPEDGDDKDLWAPEFEELRELAPAGNHSPAPS